MLIYKLINIEINNKFDDEDRQFQLTSSMQVSWEVIQQRTLT